MEQDKFMLSATIILAALAILFAIIGVATPGWPFGNFSLLTCGINCSYDVKAAGALLIIAIIFLFIAGLLAIMFLQRYVQNTNDKIKVATLALLVISVIFIVAAYSCPLYKQSASYYSYHLAVTAGILASLSTMFFTYWLGRRSVFMTIN